MKNDEQAIRALVETWLDASKRRDYSTVLSLMDNDVVFLTPGQEPFGKEGWAKRMESVHVEGQSEIEEITISGEWAWMRQRLRVIVTPAHVRPSVLSGNTLAILRKMPGGKWVIARDASLLTPEAGEKGKRP